MKYLKMSDYYKVVDCGLFCEILSVLFRFKQGEVTEVWTFFALICEMFVCSVRLWFFVFSSNVQSKPLHCREHVTTLVAYKTIAAYFFVEV